MRNYLLSLLYIYATLNLIFGWHRSIIEEIIDKCRVWLAMNIGHWRCSELLALDVRDRWRKLSSLLGNWASLKRNRDRFFWQLLSDCWIREMREHVDIFFLILLIFRLLFLSYFLGLLLTKFWGRSLLFSILEDQPFHLDFIMVVCGLL